MPITFRQLQVFDKVSEQLSYTKAARELHLSQPAVFAQVKQIEEFLGVPLVETIGKKLYLTDAGRELKSRGRAIATELDDLHQVFSELRGAARGRLRIATSGTTMPFISKMLSSFVQDHPGLSLTIDIAIREKQLLHLENNDVEFVIMGRPPEHIYDVEAFLDNPIVVVANPDHPLVKRRSIPVQELTNYDFIMREGQSTTRQSTEGFFQQNNLKLNVSIETASNESIKLCVSSGLGLGVLSLHMLGPQLRLGQIVVLDVVGFPLIKQWHIVQRKGKKLTPVAQSFRQFVIQQSRENSPLTQLNLLAGLSGQPEQHS